MTTIAIILGAISLAILLFGIIAFISTVSGYNGNDSAGWETILIIIGAIGFFLCLAI